MSLSDLMAADLTSAIFNTGDFGQSASITRDGTTITKPVIMVTQMMKTRDTQDVMVSRNWVTVLIPKSSYNFGGGVVEPSAVDEIIVDSRKYEPRKPDGMGQCWEYTDGTSLVYKVFVEEVAA